ncbi:hypothetical protein K505DRAFT_393486 [Melanomma pulvis-pyrius CBS 109.77]|uniref:SNF2 N-terminal domain-containing protein n=1 Tax=Melanomma pulvis-pyrius CBS 109.77 TaxID=1314802 RepID=A0A6A6WYL0_9PLEO|nr:hypothetical protein K505DRAFT_393486 [Melanomma pulvis-pyrius CBS 109.77]
MKKTSTAKAISFLQATKRWAVTGTPIQNDLADFFGLFRFLQFHPYDDPSTFNSHVLELWKHRPVEEAAERFKRLLSCVMIRRQKTTAAIELPQRNDKIVRIPFNSDERAYYCSIEHSEIDSLKADGRTNSGEADLSLTAIHTTDQQIAHGVQPRASVTGTNLRFGSHHHHF